MVQQRHLFKVLDATSGDPQYISEFYFTLKATLLSYRNTCHSNSALMLICARLRHVASKAWGSTRYMSMKHLEEMQKELDNLVAG